MSASTVEVLLVIGGGPAGLATARQKGFSVTVADSHSWQTRVRD